MEIKWQDKEEPNNPRSSVEQKKSRELKVQSRKILCKRAADDRMHI